MHNYFTFEFVAKQNQLKQILNCKYTYSAVMLFGKVFSVYITLRNSIIGIDTESRIPDLNWQTIFQIQKTHLTNILQLTACLAYLSLLKPCITPRPPPEDRKWSCANLTFLIIICSCLHQSYNII